MAKIVMNTQTTISIEFPTEILSALNDNESELKKDIKTFLAIKYFQQKKLTVGKAAQLAELSRLEFDNLLSDLKIPISNLEFEDIENDILKLIKR